MKLAFINNKGGCGKSTSLFHVAGELANRGNRVLVLDFDKQRDTTTNFLSEDESKYDPKNSLTVLDYLKGECSFEECVKKNFIRVGNRKPSYYGIDVIPGDKKLENQSILKELIEQRDIRSLFSNLNYDYILVDCPPSNKGVEKIVLEQIADSVIVPMSADLNAIRGYGQLLEKIDHAREKNEDLKVIGIFFSMFFKNRGKNKEYDLLMRKKFADLYIDVQIPNTADIVKAIEDKGQPISFYKKEKSGARESIVKLVNRIEKDN